MWWVIGYLVIGALVSLAKYIENQDRAMVLLRRYYGTELTAKDYLIAVFVWPLIVVQRLLSS